MINALQIDVLQDGTEIVTGGTSGGSGGGTGDVSQQDLADAKAELETKITDVADKAADDLSDHAVNTSLHVQSSERIDWNAKLDWKDLAPAHRIYCSSTATLTGDGTMQRPFATMAEALAKAGTRENVLFELGSGSVFAEDLIITDKKNWSFRSWGQAHNIGAEIRSMEVTGESDQILLESVNVSQNLTVHCSEPTEFTIANSRISGTINFELIEATASHTTEDVFTINNCGLIGDVNIMGSDGTIDINNSFFDYDSAPMLTMDANGGILTIDACWDVRGHRKQGEVNIDGGTWLEEIPYAPGFCFLSDNTPGEINFTSASTLSYESVLRPIKLDGTAKFRLGAGFEFLGAGSVLRGEYNSAGVGSLQVRDNITRPGYTPRIVDNNLGASPEGRTIADCQKDQNNGISDALLMGRKIRNSDVGLTFNGSVAADGTVSGGWAFGLTNASSQSVINIKDKNNNDWLKFDVSAASAGILGVATIDGPTSPYSETAGYSTGDTIHYDSRAYVAKQDIPAPAGPFDEHFWDVPHDDYTVWKTYKAWSEIFLVNGYYWCAESNIALTQDVLNIMSAGTPPSEPSGWFRFKDMPVAGKYLCFFLSNRANGFISVLDLNQFTGGEAITISASGSITLSIDPASNLTKRAGLGIGFADDYQAMSKEESVKLAALPTAVELDTTFAGKVNTQPGMGLSQNSFTNDLQSKLGALPDNTTLQNNLTSKTNKAAGASTASGIIDYASDSSPYMQRGNKTSSDTTAIGVNGDGVQVKHWNAATQDITITLGTNYDKGIFANTAFGRTGDNDYWQGKEIKTLAATKLDSTANAVSATKLATARTFTGQLVNLASTSAGTAPSFDGSANITLPQAGITGILPVANQIAFCYYFTVNATSGVVTIYSSKTPASITIRTKEGTAIAGTMGTLGATTTFTPTTTSQTILGDFTIDVR